MTVFFCWIASQVIQLLVSEDRDSAPHATLVRRVGCSVGSSLVVPAMRQGLLKLAELLKMAHL